MDRLRSIALLFIASALVVACAVGPDFKRPEVAVSANWSPASDPRIASQAAADSRWWKAFNDPVLDRLIELAYHQNLPLQIAGLRIVEARAQLAVVTGYQYPQLQQIYAKGNAIGLTRQQANIVSPERLERNYFLYGAGFDAAWELDFWGKFRRGVEAGEATLVATLADYYSALVSITAEVARTYAMIRTFEELIDEARENVAVQEDGLRIADARFRNGATSELDVVQATSLLESTRASIPPLRTNAQQARNALSTLLGQPTGGIDVLLGGGKPVPNAPAKVAVSVPAEMLRRRPDIRRAELYAAAQCARIGVAKAELYPAFSLFGSVGLRAATSGISSHNLFSGQSFFYSAGPQITWPFFNYGRLVNGVRVEDARFQQLIVDYRNTVLKAAQEVEDALVAFLNAQEAVVSEDRSVKAAQRAVQIALSAYQQGSVDYERVLDAQRALLREQNNLTQFRSSVTTSAIAIYKALGGGWEWAQGDAIVPEGTRREMKERTNWGDMLSDPPTPEGQKKLAPGKP